MANGDRHHKKAAKKALSKHIREAVKKAIRENVATSKKGKAAKKAKKR